MTSVTASFTELLEHPGTQFDDQLLEFFAPDEPLTYQVNLPDDESPVGLLIYISPKPGARLPETWESTLKRRNLAWVAAENSGNEIHVARRVGMALLAIPLVEQQTDLNREQIILAGFSGGGRVASMMMPVYPQLFSGALFICGANPLYTATPEAITALQSTPMVFLTGSGDFNLEDTRMAIESYQQAGVPAQLSVVDGLGHALPDATELAAAVTSLITAGA